MTMLYEAKVHVVGGREGKAHSLTGNLDVILQKPASMGGDGTGPGTNPEELFATAYAACFMGATRRTAENQGVAVPDDFAINSCVALHKGDDGLLSLAVHFDIYLTGMSLAEAEKLIEGAHQICPYSRATRGNIDVAFCIHV